MKPKVFIVYGMWVCDSGHFNPVCKSTPVEAWDAWFYKLKEYNPDIFDSYIFDWFIDYLIKI